MAADGPDDPMGGAPWDREVPTKQEVKQEVQVKTEDATLASSCKFQPPVENFRDSTLEHCKKLLDVHGGPWQYLHANVMDKAQFAMQLREAFPARSIGEMLQNTSDVFNVHLADLGFDADKHQAFSFQAQCRTAH